MGSDIRLHHSVEHHLQIKVKIVINMVTWKDHASWKNLLTELGRGNNRKITDSIRAIRQTAHPMHHGGESPTAQLPEVG
jgi:hypothetical protein